MDAACQLLALGLQAASSTKLKEASPTDLNSHIVSVAPGTLTLDCKALSTQQPVMLAQAVGLWLESQLPAERARVERAVIGGSKITLVTSVDVQRDQASPVMDKAETQTRAKEPLPPLFTPEARRVDLLLHKQTPLQNLTDEEKAEIPIVALISDQVDVGPILERLKQLGPEVWEPEYQAKHNCAMKRWGHDYWGVGKLVHIFSDDYLSKHIRLPFWNDWKDLLEPMLLKMHIAPQSVVRMMFARLPAGTVIPPHFDTGEWVRHSHRVHVPLVTDPNVIFCVGKHASDANRLASKGGPNGYAMFKGMRRVLFPVGHAIELNNMATHAVEYRKVAGGEQVDRIHMIFDWVEDLKYAPKPIMVQPGGKLFQHRRTVDVGGVCKRKFSFPGFLVLGAQKAGTTAMYDYINQHPLIVPAKGKELHFFDWKWNPKGVQDKGLAWSNASAFKDGSGKGAKITALRSQYAARFAVDMLKDRPSLTTGEATPSYLLGGATVARRVYAVTSGKVKFVVLLRDPVQRSYSQYNMVVDPTGTEGQKQARGVAHVADRSFEDVVQSDIDSLETARKEATEMHTGEEEVEWWQRYLRRDGTPFTHGGHSFVGRGCYAQQIKHWFRFFPREQFLFVHTADMMHDEGRQAVMDKVFQHLEIPPQRVEANAKGENRRAYTEPMSDTIRDTLNAFYRPHNEELERLLGPEWSSDRTGWGR